MPPRPYSERSVLPRDSSNSSVSVDSDSPQLTVDTSPGALSSATTPSPVDSQLEFNIMVPEIEEEEELNLDHPASSFYPSPADSMPFDHAFPDFIRQLTNENDLGKVQSLRIKVISRLVSLQRISLFTTNLRELDLEGSVLGSLRDIGCNLKVLQVLKVGNCQLDSLDGTFGLTSLRQLYAQRNLITDVSPCSNLPHIQHIDISNNRIRNISYAGFLSVCRKLESIVFSGNPAVSHPDYRSYVKKILPQLQSLDDLPFTNHENSEIGKNVDQDESEADFDDLNENIQRDLYHNGIGHGDWARLDQRIASANDDCHVSCNLDSEIQTILKLDTGSCKGRDFSLLSLRKEKEESREFKLAQVNRGMNMNTKLTEETDNDFRLSVSHQNEENLTLPPLTVTEKDTRKPVADPCSSGPKTEKLKLKVNEKPSTSLVLDLNNSLDAEAIKTGARPRFLKKLERPSSAHDCASNSGNMNNESRHKNDEERRPFTAGSELKAYERGSGDEEIRTLPQKSLTSGLPICGNLAVAMRHRKRQQEKVEMQLSKQKENQEVDSSDVQ